MISDDELDALFTDLAELGKQLHVARSKWAESGSNDDYKDYVAASRAYSALSESIQDTLYEN